MDIQELDRIEGEAIADEAAENPAAEAAAPQVLPDVTEEFTDFLDFAAKIAGQGLNMPTIQQRFSHEANAGIAAAAVKLCEKYNYDPRSVLIGADSTIGAWLGLAVAIGLPGFALYKDIQIAQEKEVKQTEAANDDQYSKQSSK